MYVDKLDVIVKKYSNTFETIIMRPVDIKSGTYFDSSKEINHKDPKFKFIQNIKHFN